MEQSIELYHVKVPKYSHRESAFTRTVLSTGDLAEASRRADREREYSRFAFVTNSRGAIVYEAPAPRGA